MRASGFLLKDVKAAQLADAVRTFAAGDALRSRHAGSKSRRIVCARPSARRGLAVARVGIEPFAD
jgi:DNA-binding NarL/FixJ family response regulator